MLIILCLYLLVLHAHESIKCPPKGQNEGRVVVPGYGVVEGRVECNHIGYLGLPFAKPPTGSLRWRPPQPLDAPSGRLQLFNASSFAPSCIQLRSDKLSDIGRMLLGLGAESEDCLYLNIFKTRTKTKSSDPLPVLVFIHGGEFSNGGSSAPLYNPIDLIVNGFKGAALFVSFDYRLNMFGFATSNALLKDSGEPVGNYGLLDQAAAISWVRKNIRAFGGDPDNVTVMGQSAGAMSASYLQMLFPDLASKWILFSGTASGWHYRHANGTFENKIWDLIANEAGCSIDDVQCMKNVEAGQLITSAQAYRMDYLFGPTIDHRLIRGEPWDLLQRSSKWIGPTLLTVVKDEASLFIGSMIKTNDDYERLVRKYYDKQLADRILQRYSIKGYMSGFNAANAAITDGMFTCPAIRYYNQLPRASFTQFNHPMLIPSMATLLSEGRDYGVFHGSDLVLFFNFDPFVTLPSLTEMEEMRRGIHRFLLTGTPLPLARPITLPSIWTDGLRILYQGQCQAVWSLHKEGPVIPQNFRSNL